MAKKTLSKTIMGVSFFSVLLWGGVLPLASAQTDPNQLDALSRLQDAQDSQRVAVQRAQQQAQAEEWAEWRSAERAAWAREEARRKQADAFIEDTREYLHAKREIEIEKERAGLQLDLAKAKHSEDYVKADLGQKQAETDSVAANNEATRNVATGTQQLLEASGKAEKMKQRHWWESKD